MRREVEAQVITAQPLRSAAMVDVSLTIPRAPQELRRVNCTDRLPVAGFSRPAWVMKSRAGPDVLALTLRLAAKDAAEMDRLTALAAGAGVLIGRPL